MPDDLISATFADLDAYYPNSKRKRKVIEPKPPEISPNPTWDNRPYKKVLPNGKEVEMFTIGAVAAAMGRPVITIRVWENEGYLPASPYRLPAKKNSKGEDQKGRRLYSRSMVEKLIELFDSAGLLHVKRVEWSLHRQLSIEIAEAWSKIRADETNANQ
ncbi:hypothetical protein UFOVP965_53 [uncultured Caudovirales phage]|uniref:HTH merR-type domain-containing protein n=1 Tax=uncultured Caudovirales phage TaxID=2100421 RepID=A0A6J5PSB7_9CAUD|nr:hypothetical protein UFOVP965_53 [uncultured Caudovirales phage]CAB4179785.1 hypothetical protein UFOVP1035_49 [uncultured Caudovirales phage]CAB4188305.1 hypothetical protein UFOVP1181_8 [uncultured Caudovirales phage]